MNNRIKIIIGTVIFIIVLIGADRLLKMRNVNNKEIQFNSKEISNVLEVTDNTFDEEVLNSDKKVLIDFYATWCEPCKELSPIVDEVSQERNDIKFVKIDVDKNENLSDKYSIYSIPTLVVIENGEEVNRGVGLMGKDKINELLNK